MLVVLDQAAGRSGVGESALSLPPERFVEAGRATCGQQSNGPPLGDLCAEPQHHALPDALALTLRVGGNTFYVADGAPRTVPEPEPSGDGAGVADKLIAVAH